MTSPWLSLLCGRCRRCVVVVELTVVIIWERAGGIAIMPPCRSHHCFWYADIIAADLAMLTQYIVVNARLGLFGYAQTPMTLT